MGGRVAVPKKEERAVVKLPPKGKLVSRFNSTMGKAIADFAKTGEKALEKSEGVPKNEAWIDVAKSLGYWNENEERIDNVKGFMARVKKILNEAKKGMKSTVPALWEEVISNQMASKATSYANTDHIDVDADTLSDTLDIFRDFFNMKYGIVHRTGGESHGADEKGRIPITLGKISIDVDGEGIRWATVVLDWTDDRYFKESMQYGALMPKEREPTEFQKPRKV